MNPNELQEFGARYAAAWCSQRPEEVAAFFSETAALSVNGGEPASGRVAIAGIAKGFMTSFPDMRVTLDELVESAEGTEFHWTLTGTNAGPGGMPVSALPRSLKTAPSSSILFIP